jgi:cell division inhibitor SepF
MSLGASLRRVAGHLEGGTDGSYDDETVRLPKEYLDHLGEPADLRSRTHAATDFDEIYAAEPSPRIRRSERAATPLSLVRPPSTGFCLVAPQTFNDARQIGDRFRSDTAVICNLQGCETLLAQRLTDFCSGLAYCLDGTLSRLDEKILVLSPCDVELSSEAAAGFLQEGLFGQA